MRVYNASQHILVLTFKFFIMKNKLFLFATFVFVSLTTFATTNTSTYNRYNNNYGDTFTFVERGVTFSVFQNGEFDFYINPRRGLHVGYQGNGVNISFNSGYNYDAYVQYDDYGAIIQIENIPIYYDYYGRVERVGNINLNYRYGRLARLGGLNVYYNSYGSYTHCSGYINRYNRDYVYHPYHNFFARPFFEYRVVSYRAYRNHYKPNRHNYYRDHSRNKYYNKYQKRSNHNTRQRYSTNNIPKRKNDRIASVDRSNSRAYSNNRTNRSTRYNSNNSTTRRTTSDRRDNTRSINTRKSTVTKRAPIKNNKKRTVSTKRKVDRTINNKRVATNSKRPAATKSYRNKTVKSRKPASRTVKERKTTVRSKSSKPVSRKATSTDNKRKRRS